MKLSVTFTETEREQVMKIVELVKTAFPEVRVRSPILGNDWKLHIYMSIAKH